MKTYKGTPEVDDFDIAGPVIVHDPEGKRGPQYPLNPRFDLQNHAHPQAEVERSTSA